ncbi:hypothetical protein ACONRW_004542 [Vibrio parahaemolyticus]|nr:hypothetical protein [Vibrio parahaemolyticus]MBE5191706.1 hypothetical protein [Vibrio parahaemolyticus]HCG5600746.1 hypothetical protein [Vibrio parahaemolyticus]HCG5616754.1 hypothetical protein [Vibrio parahaemolyticus]
MLSFIYGVLLSIISGIYAGLVVARFIKFEEVRKSIKRIIHDVKIVHYAQEDDHFLSDNGDYTQLSLCYRELKASNHNEAAEKINMLLSLLANFNDINSKTNKADIEKLKTQLVSIPDSITPNIWVLVSFKLAI